MSAPIIKFKTGGWGKDLIERVECARETEQSVWVGESRLAKISDRVRFYDTWELARAHLLRVAENEVLHARLQLEVANSELGNIKCMKPPKESV